MFGNFWVRTTPRISENLSVKSIHFADIKFRVFGMFAIILSLVMIATSVTTIRANAAQSDLDVTVAPGGIDEYNLQDTGTIGVETFDDRDLVLGDNDLNRTGGQISFGGAAGTFSGVGWIQGSSAYGGANSVGGTVGRFATANGDEITLTMPETSNYEYVGFWWSGGNRENHVELIHEDGTVGATFTVDVAGDDDLANLVGNCGQTPRTEWCGNQNYTPAVILGEPYAFVHIRYPPGFRQVRFSGDGFEFDNVTVSQTIPDRGNETSVVNFDPYTLSTASQLIADPRAASVTFPGVALGDGIDEENAMICFAQVAQGGGAFTGSVTIEASGSGTGISVDTDTNLVAFSGDRDTVVDFASTILLEAVTQGQQFGVGSVYLRVSVTPEANLGTAGCSGTNSDSSVVEVRFLNILKANSSSISID